MSDIKIDKDRNYYFQLSEYLQIACNGMHSVRMNITENGLLIGNIIVDNGNLLNAIDKVGEGEDAFKRLVLNKNINVELKQLGEDEKKQNIDINCEELIFRIFTTKDREKSIMDLSNKTVHELSPLEKKMGKGKGLLLDKDYKLALKVFKEIEREYPKNKEIQSILKRLNELL